MAQNQKREDDNVRDLMDSLGEMAGAASACPDLKKIEGTADVAEEIGEASLEAAILIHDYVDPSIRGHAKFAGLYCFQPFLSSRTISIYIGRTARIIRHTLSDMSSRIANTQKRCKGLTEKLERRVAIDTNVILKDAQLSEKSYYYYFQIPREVWH